MSESIDFCNKIIEAEVLYIVDHGMQDVRVGMRKVAKAALYLAAEKMEGGQTADDIRNLAADIVKGGT